VDRVLGARFALGRRLGRGATAETFVAQDVDAGDACVVKVFDDATRAATDEFGHLLSLAHRSVVRVRHVGRAADGRAFLVTDLVPGAPLASLASLADEAERRRAFSRAARDLADALAHLHARGVVHGDVCSANVRFDAAGRAVLLDFGLSGPTIGGGARGGARGTLGYAAPEALTGARTPASDLFGLGATLFEAWTGATPFGRGLPAAQRMLTTRAPKLSSVRGGLGDAWDTLVERLLDPEPRRRPASARELLREIGRAVGGAGTSTEADLGVPYPEGDPLEGLVVGRAAERARLRLALERLAEGGATRGVVAIVGAPGSGRRTLIEGAARELAVSIAAGLVPDVDVVRGDVAELERLTGAGALAPLEPSDDVARAVQQRLARLAEALELRAVARPVVAFLAEGPLADALASLAAGALPSGRVLLVVPTSASVERAFAENVVLPPLAPEDVEELVTRAMSGEPVAPTATEALVTAGRGHAALVAVLARRLVAGLRAGADIGLPPGLALDAPGTDLDSVLARDFASMPLAAREVVVAVALAGERARGLTAFDDAAWRAAIVRARDAGWLRRGDGGDGGDVLASRAHVTIALGALATPAFADLARRAAETLTDADPRRADALVALGRRAEAAALLRALAARADGDGEPERAASWLEEAAALAPGALTAREHVVRAGGLGALGRYADAARALDAAAGCAAGPADRALVADSRAWLLARTGDLPGASAVLEEALGAAHEAGDAATSASLRARLGRLLVTAGRFADALVVLEREGVDAASPLAVEATILALAYQGDVAAARARLASPAGARALAA